MIAGIVAAIWAAILLGFGIDLVRRAAAHQLQFPLVVHLHVLAYGSWLVLLAAQVWLVRTRRVTVHRRLGWLAAVLIPMMLVLGCATAWWQATNPYVPDRWIDWLCVEFTNAIGSAVLLAAGMLALRRPAAHKRLMLMGTIAMTEPGFGRVIEPMFLGRMEAGYLPLYFATYSGTLALIVAVGVYDRLTRGRLHPAYTGAAAWIIANQALATWLFFQPFWLAWARALTGHAPE